MDFHMIKNQAWQKLSYTTYSPSAPATGGVKSGMVPISWLLPTSLQITNQSSH